MTGYLMKSLLNDQIILSRPQNRENRTKKGEKRCLTFDGHSAHLPLEFLRKYENHQVIPFGLVPHSTHLCQPLDGKTLLNYK